ncbi:hypothetical protein [Shewanella surugensis]|uniref:Uncharacterized protein n=1 Tax=Shewanella surugensis TaxID=212020 RepID=A0ABT0LEJ7_9GAMM|nr:hypothetical protein [Shewanella surugensis]MCL1126080.1 hypothetical protein [Shewanella surugensis]
MRKSGGAWKYFIKFAIDQALAIPTILHDKDLGLTYMQARHSVYQKGSLDSAVFTVTIRLALPVAVTALID